MTDEAPPAYIGCYEPRAGTGVLVPIYAAVSINLPLAGVEWPDSPRDAAPESIASSKSGNLSGRWCRRRGRHPRIEACRCLSLHRLINDRIFQQATRLTNYAAFSGCGENRERDACRRGGSSCSSSRPVHRGRPSVRQVLSNISFGNGSPQRTSCSAISPGTFRTSCSKPACAPPGRSQHTPSLAIRSDALNCLYPSRLDRPDERRVVALRLVTVGFGPVGDG
jgi:hypothetical protein